MFLQFTSLFTRMSGENTWSTSSCHSSNTSQTLSEEVHHLSSWNLISFNGSYFTRKTFDSQSTGCFYCQQKELQNVYLCQASNEADENVFLLSSVVITCSKWIHFMFYPSGIGSLWGFCLLGADPHHQKGRGCVVLWRCPPSAGLRWQHSLQLMGRVWCGCACRCCPKENQKSMPWCVYRLQKTWNCSAETQWMAIPRSFHIKTILTAESNVRRKAPRKQLPHLLMSLKAKAFCLLRSHPQLPSLPQTWSLGCGRILCHVSRLTALGWLWAGWLRGTSHCLQDVGRLSALLVSRVSSTPCSTRRRNTEERCWCATPTPCATASLRPTWRCDPNTPTEAYNCSSLKVQPVKSLEV